MTTVRIVDLVAPLAIGTGNPATDTRIKDTAGDSPDRSCAVSRLSDHPGDVDSAKQRSTRTIETMPGTRISTTATRTTTTRALSSSSAPSADQPARHHAEFSSVAILFARADSNYKALPGCDVWDIERDARRWPGGSPVVAHPPCRAWGQLRALANPRHDEKELALWALAQVQRYGGVLEHPATSTLWPVASLPRPGANPDKFGGWTLPIYQFWFGHRAEKPTYLYIVGCDQNNIPPIPLRLGNATHICGTSGRRRDGGRLHKGDPGWRPEITKAEREHTPPQLARWLVALARICGANK